MYLRDESAQTILRAATTEIEDADQTFYLTQSQYTDTGPTSPSADLITPGAWQGKPLECQFLSHWYDSTPKKSRRKRDSNPGSSALEADALPLGQRGGPDDGKASWYSVCRAPRWWNDGWPVKTVVTWRSSASMIPAPDLRQPHGFVMRFQCARNCPVHLLQLFVVYIICFIQVLSLTQGKNGDAACAWTKQ